MAGRFLLVFCFAGSSISPVFAQQHQLSQSTTYHRVMAVTPLIGAGTAADPKRPMFVPAPPAPSGASTNASASAVTRSGVLGYQMQLSDDGNHALVELVFQNPQEFQNVLAAEAQARGITVTPALMTAPPAQPSGLQTALEAAVPGLKMFERGKATQQQVLTFFQQYKKNFQFSPIGVAVQ
jgi:hypothetical protein